MGRTNQKPHDISCSAKKSEDLLKILFVQINITQDFSNLDNLVQA